MKALPEDNITPDYWVALSDGDDYLIVSGFNGGYLASSCYRRSTPVTLVEEEKTRYLVDTESGSSYILYKSSERVGSATVKIIESLAKLGFDKVGLNDFKVLD